MDIASLGVEIKTKGVAQSARELEQFQGTARRTEGSMKSMAATWTKATAAFGVAALALTTRELLRQGDAFQQMKARLSLVAGDMRNVMRVQGQLFEVAQRTGTSLETINDLYVKLGQSSKALASDQAQLMRVTELVGKSLVISGADAASSSAVVRQFSQALAAGALRGDEFVSVMEGAPRLARALADGLGVPIGKLRELAAEGKLTAATVTESLTKSGQAIDAEFAKMPLTVGRAMTEVRNSLTQMMGKADDAAGSSRELATSIRGVAQALNDPAVREGFQAFASGLADVIRLSALAAGEIGKLWQVGQIASGSRSLDSATTAALKERRKQLQANIDLGAQWRKEEGNIVERLAGGRDFTAYDSMVAEVKRIDALLNYKPGGGPSNGRGRGISVSIRQAFEAPTEKDKPKGSTKSPALSEAEREAAQLLALFDRTKSSMAEQIALFGSTTEAAKMLYATQHGEFAKFSQLQKDELVRLAQRKDALAHEAELEQVLLRAREEQDAAFNDMNESLREQIALLGMSESMQETILNLTRAGVSAESERGRQIIDNTRELQAMREAFNSQVYMMDALRAEGSNFLYDWTSGAKGFKDSMLDALDSVHKRFLQMISENLMEQLLGKVGTTGKGSAGGDWISGLFESFGSLFGKSDSFTGFARGGYTGNAGVGQVAGVVHGQEYVLNASATKRLGVANLDRLNAGGSVGGGVSLVQNITIQERLTGTTEEQASRKIGSAAQRGLARTGRSG